MAKKLFYSMMASGGLKAKAEFTILDMLEDEVKAHSDRCCVQYGDSTLSYLEFFLTAKAIGNYLNTKMKALQAGTATSAAAAPEPEKLGEDANHPPDAEDAEKFGIVGLYADPSEDMVCGAWGILHSGHAYLPLAPEYPAERLNFMITDSNVRLIFAQSHLKKGLANVLPTNVEVVTLEDIILDQEQQGSSQGSLLLSAMMGLSGGGGGGSLLGPLFPLSTQLSREAPAYIIYTSGSTGRPKGVVISHGNIANQMSFLKQEFGFGAATKILQKTPISFDAAQWEILSPVFGCQMVVGPPGCYRDPDLLIGLMIKHRVNTLQCVPTLLRALLDNPSMVDCSSLTQIFSGGEALTRKLAKRFFETLKACSLVNLYGPTECTINASIFEVREEELDKYPKVISIGRPVGNTRFYVLDPATGEVVTSPNQEGELHISGVQVAKCYLNNPELTRAKFKPDPFWPGSRMYATGDKVTVGADGNYHFSGRADDQVKLRGHRVQLDEIRSTIEEHGWIKRAAMLVRTDPRTDTQYLLACIELDEEEAALMDQGNYGSHHATKSSKLQVKAQLSFEGFRTEAQCQGKACVKLPSMPSNSLKKERSAAFIRKTYRFYEGEDLEPVTRGCLATLLAETDDTVPRRFRRMRQLPDLTFEEFGHLMQGFGPFFSDERLLPKYSYASPGALYAVQMYFEIRNMFKTAPALNDEATKVNGFRKDQVLEDGIYYFHPSNHQLICMTHADDPMIEEDLKPMLRIHFVGKTGAIQRVYKNNVVEVLEMETGHILGHFDQVLPVLGLGLGKGGQERPGLPDWYKGEPENHYIGHYDLVGAEEAAKPENRVPPTDVYVQTHGNRVEGMPHGLYKYVEGQFQTMPVSAQMMVLKRDVIAINQHTYMRSGFGISMVCNRGPEWQKYICLGRKLQRLQANSQGFGFMSSGYSSKTGNDLPSAKKMRAALQAIADHHRLHPSTAHDRGVEQPDNDDGGRMDSFYFCTGGRVSLEQWTSEGMKEDSVHMMGPAELVKEDLKDRLPQYMIPNKVLVFDRLPLTSNGKIDHKALALTNEVAQVSSSSLLGGGIVVPLRTETMRQIGAIWMEVMKWESVSAHDDFFESGGNSLMAVAMINKINARYKGIRLPLQALFESPTLEKLATVVDDALAAGNSGGDGGVQGGLVSGVAKSFTRMILLHNAPVLPDRRPVFCWPGLGGYPMNLRTLGTHLVPDRPFYGVQAFGINPGEVPYGNVSEMALRDVEELLRIQPQGPYTLWGYSFGARVAFEMAFQLEQRGKTVSALFLLAPGSPDMTTISKKTGLPLHLLHSRHHHRDANNGWHPAAEGSGRAAAYPARNGGREADFGDKVFLSTLFSVFDHNLHSSATTLRSCLETVRDKAAFVEFICKHYKHLDLELVHRITSIVELTYSFDYSFEELEARCIKAPTVVFKAVGDDYSFIEKFGGRFSSSPPTVVHLLSDHYQLLEDSGVDEILKLIEAHHINMGNSPTR